MSTITSQRPNLRVAIALLSFGGLLLTLVILTKLTPSATTAQAIPVQCDLTQQTCAFRFAQHNLSLSFENQLQVMSANTLTLHNIATELDAVSITFSGVDMYMGINKFTFTPDLAEQLNWQSNIELPLCTTGVMTWQALLTLQAGVTSQQFLFTFDL